MHVLTNKSMSNHRDAAAFDDDGDEDFHDWDGDDDDDADDDGDADDGDEAGFASTARLSSLD